MVGSGRGLASTGALSWKGWWTRVFSGQFDSQRRGFTTADAQAGYASLGASLAQSAQQRHDNARARGADGVAERASTAMHVDALVGGPAPSAAWCAGAWPRPAGSTQPVSTSCTTSGARPARFTVARMACAPSYGAVSDAKLPCKLPSGVRAALAMTTGSSMVV